MKKMVLFFRISYYILIIPFLVYIKKLPKLCNSFTPKKCKPRYSNEEIIRLTNFLVGLKIPTSRNLCLKKSLILYRLLRENGLDVCINVGINASGQGNICGHSWLTLKGEPFYVSEEEKQARQFELIYAFPSKNDEVE